MKKNANKSLGQCGTDGALRRANIHPRHVAALCLGAALFSPCVAFGLGVAIPNQDPEAIGRGNAFAATANNPSALFYNPAGITQLPGYDFQLGLLNYLGINTSYHSLNGANYTHTDFQVVPVPELYCTFTPEKAPLPVSFGLGIYAPFGLGDQWPQNSGFRSLAIEARLLYTTINPVIAIKPCDSLSLAIGPTINYSQIKISRGLFTPDDELDFAGSGFSFGFNAGVLWQPVTQWSFGVQYRSASTMDYEGHTTYGDPAHFSPFPNGRVPTTADFNFPQIVSGGISYRPTPKWNVEVDVDWTDWDTLKTVTLNGTASLFPGVGNLPLQLDWHGSEFYKIGATRYFNHGWYGSAGYFYSTQTTRSQTFNPGVPDTDLHVGSLGVGRKGDRWDWALSTQIIVGPYRTVDDSQPSPAGESANGRYQLFVPTVSFSVGYHF